MTIETKTNNKQILDSVHNALRILKSFSKDEPIHSVTELSRSLDLHKSTVSRIIATLVQEGFIVKDLNSRSYRLGPTLFSLGNAFQFSQEIYKVARPILKKLVEQAGETAQLGILDRSEVLFIESIETNHPLRFMTAIGSRSPIYCSSVGRVLLAFREDHTLLENIIEDGLTPWTNKTIIEESKFRKEIEQIREDGFAISYEEKYEGVIAIAAPILNQKGEAIAAINVVGPSYRLKPQTIIGVFTT